MVEQISDGFEGSQIIKSHKNTSRRYYLKAETLLLYNTGTSKDNDQNEHKKSTSQIYPLALSSTLHNSDWICLFENLQTFS